MEMPLTTMLLKSQKWQKKTSPFLQSQPIRRTTRNWARCFWTGPESEIRIARIDTKWAALGGDEVVWRLGGAFGGSTRSLLFGLTAPGVKAPGSPASQG